MMRRGKYAIAISLALLALFVLPIFISANPATAAVLRLNDSNARDTESYVVESPHNYPNNYDNTWTITKSGATKIKVHFTSIQTEYSYDYVYVYDANNNRINTYSGTYSDVWSAESNGDTIYVRLKSDYSVTKWGFKIDKIYYETGGSGGDEDVVLTSGNAENGYLSATGDKDYYKIEVPSGATQLKIVTDGPSNADFDLYAKLGSRPTTSSYDYRAYTSSSDETITISNPSAGWWYIMVNSYSGSGSYSITATVTAGSSTTDIVLESGVAHSDSLSATGDKDYYKIEVQSGATQLKIVTDGPSNADFDLYAKLGSRPTTSSYDYRAYTSSSDETITISNPAAGWWYIMVNSYSGSGSYSITATITSSGGGGGSGGDGVVNRYAVIVGISDYKAISDLSYCDEDATDWYNYLHNMGYQIVVYGDTHSSNYPRYDGVATEANVKAAISNMVQNADADDIIAYISSGHGSGDGNGNSYLCMWDCSSGEDGEDGNLYDTELAELFAPATANVFIFLDHCYSGGMDEVVTQNSNGDKVFLTTTCTANGYGYDDSDHQNGAWTYWFLEAGLIGHFNSDPNTSMEDAFAWAVSQYPHSGGDTPQKFDGNTSQYFYL